MTTQKNRWQEYSAALQNDLCSLRDAIEEIAKHHRSITAIRLNFSANAADLGREEAYRKLHEAVDAAVKIARGE